MLQTRWPTPPATPWSSWMSWAGKNLVTCCLAPMPSFVPGNAQAWSRLRHQPKSLAIHVVPMQFGKEPAVHMFLGQHTLCRPSQRAFLLPRSPVGAQQRMTVSQ